MQDGLKLRPSLFSQESKSIFAARSKPLSTYLGQSKASPLLLLAGEHSGDLMGGELLGALHSLGYHSFFGTGGQSMAAQGLELLEDIENMSVVGLVEALGAYPYFKRLSRRLLQEAQKRRIKCAILIDYPGFNLAFAAMLKAQGIQVIYLVSPQIWAWHFSRIHKIKANVDLMLTLFPFEEKIYQNYGVEAYCIGHPLIYRLPRQLLKEKQLPASQSSGKKSLVHIGILPGSRSSEVKRLLPIMLKAASLIHKKHPACRFLIGGINQQLEKYIRQQLSLFPKLPAEYYFASSLRIMQLSKVLVMASGTVSLEASYFKKAMVVLYRTSWINALLISLAARLSCISMPNLLARRHTVPELLQTEVTPSNIMRSVEAFLVNPSYMREVTKELGYVRDKLGTGNPAQKAALHINTFLERRK